MPDPFMVLGLSPGASAAEVRTARRTLALRLHPDHGGDPHQMQLVNEAYVAAMASLSRTVGATPHTRSTVSSDAFTSTGHVERDAPSFVIELLPVEAFEALLVVTSWIGEVLVDEPPYLLEVHLYPPIECWCRLELVPDAGASTVSLTIDGAAQAEVIRDAWVAALNELGPIELGVNPTGR